MTQLMEASRPRSRMKDVGSDEKCFKGYLHVEKAVHGATT